MSGSKKFEMLCIIGCVVALCLGMLGGSSVSAQEPTAPPTIMQPPVLVPPSVVVAPPVMTQFQNYQIFLVRLLKLNAEIEAITLRIQVHEVMAALDPNDPFIQFDLQMLYFQLGMMQMELTEVRAALDYLNR